MKLRKNVVEYLWVVHAKIGDGKYQFRVQAESETTAREKAKKQMGNRFNAEKKCEIIGIEKIDPAEDFID